MGCAKLVVRLCEVGGVYEVSGLMRKVSGRCEKVSWEVRKLVVRCEKVGGVCEVRGVGEKLVERCEKVSWEVRKSWLGGAKG